MTSLLVSSVEQLQIRRSPISLHMNSSKSYRCRSFVTPITVKVTQVEGLSGWR
jgi:hypothetical protein